MPEVDFSEKLTDKARLGLLSAVYAYVNNRNSFAGGIYEDSDGKINIHQSETMDVFFTITSVVDTPHCILDTSIIVDKGNYAELVKSPCKGILTDMQKSMIMFFVQMMKETLGYDFESPNVDDIIF